jgi:hypothetical protein
VNQPILPVNRAGFLPHGNWPVHGRVNPAVDPLGQTGSRHMGARSTPRAAAAAMADEVATRRSAAPETAPTTEEAPLPPSRRLALFPAGLSDGGRGGEGTGWVATCVAQAGRPSSGSVRD